MYYIYIELLANNCKRKKAKLGGKKENFSVVVVVVV